MKTTSTEIPEIVKRAMVCTITDIGQLDKEEKRQLGKYVKVNVLIKGKGGPYPKLKTVYAIKGYNINKARKESIEEMMAIVKYENYNKIKL